MKLPSTLLISSLLLTAVTFQAQSFAGSDTKKLNFNLKENKGQVSDQFSHPRPDILFSGNSGDMQFHLRSTGISYQVSRVDRWEERTFNGHRPDLAEKRFDPASVTIYRLDVNWLQANTSPQIEYGKMRDGVENYYLASCPEGALNVRSFTDVLYKNVYPGIDLKWYEKNGNLKYDYLVAAHADHKKIRLEYKGAESITVNRDGELVIKTPLGTFTEQKPLVLQNNKVLPASWVVKDNSVSFDIRNIDPSLPLVIDPMVRLWGTYYGGTGSDQTFRVNSDAASNVYMAGWTNSALNIATTGAHQTVLNTGNNNDAFLVKFNSSGVRIWATYYGGSGDDYAYEGITDGNGNVYLVGETTSADANAISTAGAHQSAYSAAPGNTGDAFLVKFNSAGVRQWGTYYGGDNYDFAMGVCVDNSGDVYITGGAFSSTGISTPSSHQPALITSQDCFIAKFNTSGVRQWGTYYGGKALGWDCTTSASGDLYISGNTSHSLGIATSGCHQPTFGGGTNDGFYAKFNSNGALQWGTYYGGAGKDQANEIIVDAAGNLYGAGNCSMAGSTVFATSGCHQPAYGGGQFDGYLVKFDPSGVRLWGTFYGGIGIDVAGGPALDASGNVYFSGLTSSGGGTVIATECAYQPNYGGGSTDMYLAKFTNSGTRIWGSYYGSLFSEGGVGSCSDPGGSVYICGISLANSGIVLGSSNGHQPAYGGGTEDAVLARFDGCIAGPPVNLTPPANMIVCSGNTATLNATCGNWYTSTSGGTILATGSTFTVGPVTANATYYVEDFACGSVFPTRTAISFTVVPAAAITITLSSTTPCVGEPLTITASGAATYTWVAPASNASTVQIYPLLPTTFSVTGTDANGCVGSSSVSINPTTCLGITESGMARGLAVYPNPNTGNFTIVGLEEMELRLSNELGQEIRKVTLTPANNFTTALQELPDGIYFISGEKDKMLNKKIIVIH